MSSKVNGPYVHLFREAGYDVTIYDNTNKTESASVAYDKTWVGRAGHIYA